MLREIPEGSVEIQTGLWLYQFTRIIGGKTYTFQDLYSSEGYCFYDNTLAEEERIYMQYAGLGLADNPNNYTSVPVDPSYEIVSVSNQTEIK